MTNSCDNCKFWSAEDTVSGLGECHRYPPVMALEIRRPEGVYDTFRPQDGGWPLTFGGDWCGEHDEVAFRNAPTEEKRKAATE